MKYIRLYERDTQEFYQFTKSQFKNHFPALNEIDTASFAEKWNNKIGQNYVDLNSFLLENSQNTTDEQKKNFAAFVDEKYSVYLSSVSSVFKNEPTEHFLKQVLRVM